MTNDQIKEQLELALEFLGNHSPEANLDILFMALYPDRILRFKEAELVIKFYASPTSWQGSGFRDRVIGVDLESISIPVGPDEVDFKKVGGKRARDYRKKFKGE